MVGSLLIEDMMILEPGDFFAVTRGNQLNPRLNSDGDPIATVISHDRSEVGRIYLSLAVEYPLVACRCVWSLYSDEIGRMQSLHTDELEIITLGKEYILAMGIKPEGTNE